MRREFWQGENGHAAGQGAAQELVLRLIDRNSSSCHKNVVMILCLMSHIQAGKKGLYTVQQDAFQS